MLDSVQNGGLRIVPFDVVDSFDPPLIRLEVRRTLGPSILASQVSEPFGPDLDDLELRSLGWEHVTLGYVLVSPMELRDVAIENGMSNSLRRQEVGRVGRVYHPPLPAR